MFIYLPGLINVPKFQKTAQTHNLDPKKVVFLFPGNSSHHSKGTNLYTIKGGGGLAVVAQDLGAVGYPVLSLPTTSMDNWSTNLNQQQTVHGALADLYRAVGAGYHLLLPVRTHDDTTYFDSGLADTKGDLEPSFWGFNLKTPNKPLATHYIQELNKLAVFIKLSEEERLKAVEADSSNPFFAAYLDGLQMQENDPWLQLPSTVKKQITPVLPKPIQAMPTVKKEELAVSEPNKKPLSEKEISQPFSSSLVETNDSSSDSNGNAAFDFLVYGALFTAGLGGLAVAILAWPIIVPALVAAEIISASSAGLVAATLAAVGLTIAGGATFSFFKPSIAESYDSEEKGTDYTLSPVS
ncbi:hypothetical protein ACD661_01335 [Legionella lytica]|uniref:Uncharacterized protein n=1 Tax=Legionella lytica TaxID=96232 RepID=A0ABW8D3C2_9GAMM